MRRHKLKALLLLGDAVAYVLGYTVVLLSVGYVSKADVWKVIVSIALAATIGLFAMKGQGLFLARISVVRVFELTRSWRAAILSAGVMIIVDRVLQLDLRIRYILVASFVSYLFVVIDRSIFRAWVSMRRSKGEYQRRVLVVGTDEEAARLVKLFDTHPEIGFIVIGVLGSQREAATRGLDSLWVGEIGDAETLIPLHGASGVIVSPNAVSASRLNSMIRTLQSDDVHVHLATGVSGIDARRLRSLPMSHEPLLYVEAPVLSRTQFILKRLFDVTVSLVVLAILSPVLMVIAIVIKLQDRGPVMFRQKRVGLGGNTFDVLKFRTMRVDAEAQLAKLGSSNQRVGPLFKMDRDPRVTRVGRVLRETSLDELPQLVNVLRGEMSLVGPRPALPSEVLNFDADLRQREQVLPGITGLWQVEARDNPSFEAYRRLDLFYVENWSVTLDLLIVLGTVEQLMLKIVTLLFRREKSSTKPPERPAEPHLDAPKVGQL